MAAPSLSGGLTELYASGTAVAAMRDVKSDSVLNGTSGMTVFNGLFRIQGESYGAGGPVASVRTLGTPIDLTQDHTFWACSFKDEHAVSLLSSTSGIGVAFLSPDGGGGYNEAVHMLFGDNQATVAAGDPKPALVNPEFSDNAWVVDAGFDASNITHVGIGGTQPFGYSNAGAACATNSNEYFLMEPLVLVGGEAGNLATFTDLTDWFDTNWDGRNFHTSPTPAMHYINFVYKIGDGATATNYYAENQVVQFQNPPDMSDLTGTLQNHIAENSLGHWFQAATGDDIKHKNKLFLGEQKFRFWSKGAALSGTVNDGITVIGAGDVQIDDGHVTSSCSFSGCDRVKGNAPTLINTSITDTTDTVALDITDSSNVSNLFLKNGTTGIRFDFDGSASVTLSGTTFEGFTNDIEYTGSGTLTVTATNGTVVNSTLASGSGSIVVQGAIIQQGLSFAGLQSDSQVKIYETGTTTIIDSVESSGATFEWAETYSEDQTVDYTIIKEGFIPIRVTGVALSDSVVPVAVQQVEDRAYSASSGLIFGSNVVIDTVAKTVAVSANTTVQNLYNALNEFWRDQSALQNVKFPVVTNGPNSFTFIDDWELTSGSFQYLSRDGVRYLNTSGTRTAAWAAILTAGNVTGLTAEIQQVEGAAPVDAANSGAVDQLFQIYGDASHGNFDYSNYMYIKYQANGYDEAGLNVVDQYGQLEDQLYVVAIQPSQLADFTGGDPAPVGLSITDHGISPVSWNGKSWSITIIDTGGNTGEAIHRWLNYNKSLDATFQGFEPFNLFDMVVDAGATYETRRGTIIGSSGATLKGVRVVDGSGNPHSYFTRFQCDDGSYYTPPQSINLSAPNLTPGYVQLYNVTTDTQIDYTTIPNNTTGYNYGWVDGSDFSAGDILRLRWVVHNKQPIEMITSAPASGTVSFTDTPVTDPVYSSYGINGATVTEFAPDYPNVQIDINDADNLFSMARLYAWYKHTITTEFGIDQFWGGLVALDAANIRIESDILDLYLDNVRTTTLLQQDNIRLFRKDGVLPVVNPTSGGGGISMYSTGTIYMVETGVSGLTGAESNLLTQAANSKNTEAEVHTYLDNYANKDDWKGTSGGGGLDEAGVHTALDNYTNKDGYQADLSAVLSAIAALPADTKADIADAVLDRNLGGGSNGGRTVRDALRANRNRVTVDDQAGAITVYEEDDTTVAWSGTVTTSERDPISSVDPA